MANLPHLQISTVSDMGSLQSLKSIQTTDLVGPTAANRQPDTLKSIAENLRSEINSLNDTVNQTVENLNALTGKDENGNNVTSDGNPQYLERDGSHAMLSDLDMGSHQIKGVVNGNVSTDAVTLQQLQQYYRRDGAFPLTANFNAGNNKLTNVAQGTNPSDGVNKNQLDSATSGVTPTGTITMFGGSTAPSGWLLCDGSGYAQTTYPDLHDVIGTTYGSGPGANDFRVPDLRQRFPRGAGVRGNTGGSNTHDHDVTIPHSGWSVTSDGIGEDTFTKGDLTVGTGDFEAGESVESMDEALNDQTVTSTSSSNLPPYTEVNYIIKT